MCLQPPGSLMALFPRPISRRAEADQSARPLQALIALFTKILSAVSAQAESAQTRRTKHGHPVVAGVSRNILTAQPTRHGTSPSDGGHDCLYRTVAASLCEASRVAHRATATERTCRGVCAKRFIIPVLAAASTATPPQFLLIVGDLLRCRSVQFHLVIHFLN